MTVRVVSADAPSRGASVVALIGLLLVAGGLVVAIMGQQRLTAETNPPRQYIDGRYWTINPGICPGLGADTRAACMAVDTATARANARAHQNLVTLRSMGVVGLISGAVLLVLAFVSSSRGAADARTDAPPG